MMDDVTWIVVCNWERFQHYGKAKPRWIKLYRDLLHDYAFTNLSPTNQALLMKLWLLNAETGQNVPVSTAYLTRNLGQRVTMRQLETLNHAGFIGFKSRAEVEGEKEKEQDKLASLPASPPGQILNMLNGRGEKPRLIRGVR